MDSFREEWRLAVLKPLVEKLEEVGEDGVPRLLAEEGPGENVQVEPELFFDNVKAAEELMKDLKLAMREDVSGGFRIPVVWEKISECALGDKMSATWYDAAEEVEGGDGVKEKVEEEPSNKMVAAGGKEIIGDDKAKEAASEKMEERKVWGEGGYPGEQDHSEQLDALDNLFELGPQCVVL